jgi:hypothetical protein
MAEAVGLSIGATRFAGVQPGRPPVTRQSVLTLYAQRSPELGVPGENSSLTQPGMVVTGFVDRVGDPVGMVAADGSMHRGEFLVADALRELFYTVTAGRPPAAPPTVTYPAHWRKAQVDALRTALTHVPEWSRRGQPTLVCDAAATISALQSDPGVPARGVIALCDFGGSGTSITLLDAGRGYPHVGPTVRHTDFSGDLIDQALLTHVVGELSGAVPGLTSSGATGTSALGSLHRLRGQCRGAKERLSATAVTALNAQLPGFSGDVRLTRAELEDQIRRPLTDFLCVLEDTIDRSGVRTGDVVAVASVGGGARVPLVTAMLSERFRVPVITTGHPELAAAGGAAQRASIPPAALAATAVAPASPKFADADAQSTAFRALAWSEAHDVPPLAPAVESYDEPALDAAPTGLSSARPAFEFADADAPGVAVTPWYRRRSSLLGVTASVLLLLGTSAVVAFGSDTTPASGTSPVAPPTSAAPPGAVAAPQVESPVQEQPQAPAPRTVYAVPAPATQYQATQQAAPPPQQAPAPVPAAPPAPTPSSESPAPPPPPETTTVTATTQASPSTTTVTAQPPSPQPPVTFTLPPLPSIPGLLNPRGNR